MKVPEHYSIFDSFNYVPVKVTRLSTGDYEKFMDELAGRYGFSKNWVYCDWMNDNCLSRVIAVCSYAIHGGMRLSFDSDNFEPPPFYCELAGWCGLTGRRIRAKGRTAQEAIVRAAMYRERLENKPETVAARKLMTVEY